jgi:transcriptional regulator with XRE-family HTH domain
MGEDDLESLGQEIRQAREKAGLSTRQLAARTGVHPSAIGHLETGRNRRPAGELLQRIAEVCQIEPDRLLKYIGIKPASTLLPTRMFFREKYGVSDDEADILANLVEHQIRERREGTHGDTEPKGHEHDD